MRTTHDSPDKDKAGGAAPAEAARAAQDGPAASLQSLLALQRTAGNRAVASIVRPVVQRSATAALLDPRSSDRDIARAGVTGSGSELPHRDVLEARMGTDLGKVRAHVGPAATLASQALGAKAYAFDGEVAFAEEQPSLRTVAHEVTHLGQTGSVDAPSSGHDDAEEEAEAVATSVEGGAEEKRASDARRARPSGHEPLLLTERQRQELSGIVTACLGPLGMVIRMLGFSITGAAVGFRQSATAAYGVAGSVGVDEMVFVDPIRWTITGDVVPYGELGIGLQAGGSLGAVIALRLSPLDRRVGAARDAYEGTAISGSIRALAGVGLTMSAPLLSGEEGWAGAVFTLGAEAGANFSVSQAFSMANVIGNVQTMIGQLTGVARSLQAIGDGMSAAVQSMFTSLFSVFDPAAWDLTGYTEQERAAWLRFGTYMQQAIRRTSLDRFLAEESQTPPVPISRRIQTVGDVGVFIAVSEAMRARFQRRMSASGVPDGITMEVWPANWFNNHSYLEFLRYAMDNRLLATRGAAGSPPPEVGRPREPAVAGAVDF